MSNIFGYISRTGAPIREGLARDMMNAMAGWKPDVARHTSPVANVVLGSLLLHATPESLHETLPYTAPDAGLTITADARIDNRDELATTLGLTDSIITPDSLFILRAYQKWGKECGLHLIGDYTFAVWDAPRQELFIARDHIGARALFYYADRDRFIFATEPKGILATGEAPTQLTDDWIANILVDATPAKDQAPFIGMKKLPPAHYMTVTPGNIQLKQYWELDVNREISYRRKQDYYDHLRMLMIQAVRRCTRSAYAVGAELSGGLDSSGIAAIAQSELAKRGDDVHTFSHVMPDWALDKIYPFGDERQFINSLCDHAGITHRHVITAEDKGIIDEFRLCTRRFGYPTGYPYPVYCDALYEGAQQAGVRVLLSGFPGDELVTSHGAYFMHEMLHRHRYLAMWRELYGRNGQQPLAAAYSTVMHAVSHHAPAIARLLKGNPPPETNWRNNSFACCVATEDYINKMRLRQRLFDSTAEPAFHTVREREMFRITRDFVCRRLEQCAANALYYGVEYRNPLADRNLMEYVLAMPASAKVHHGTKRYPYRMAMQGILPEDIRWRNDKAGTTIPTFHIRYVKDADRIATITNDGANTWPTCVDPAKMLLIKQRLDNKQLGDLIYPHSFLAAIMMSEGRR